MIKYSLLIFALLTLVSCDFFKTTPDLDPIARINDTYLYKKAIIDLLPKNLTKTDSSIFVNDYINRWATQQLLVQGAKLNLEETTQKEFDALVEQYKNDLYSKAYLEALVYKNLDTVVNNAEATVYFEANREAFKLNEELIKFRYVYLDKNREDIEEIKTKFERFDTNDKKELDSISIQFKSFSLDDSIWIRLNQIVSKIPVINQENKTELLKKSNFVQLKDSLGLYLMRINDVLLRNDEAPLEYVKPTIDQIVVNKRKLELIRELEKDITKDAIKNKQFEIYN